jgi:TonB family protein
MIAYFIKVNIALALFYAFYRLFCYRDTFFGWRRTALLCFFVVSALYPLFNIEAWIETQAPMTAIVTLYSGIVLPELTVGAAAEAGIDWDSVLPALLLIIYIGVAAVLLARLLLQLFSLLRLALRTPTTLVNGVRVHLSETPDGAPFSFFHWIFVSPERHTDAELNEILTHEQTHARQWHSVDVLVGELACIVCWFNPFAWLMRREIRVNLEYLADRSVLQTGYDCKTYQYHLLGLAHPKAAATIYNSFNVLPLKKRISMMNKQRTRNVGRTKYLMFVPLAALLMIVSNIETVARSIERAEQSDNLSLRPDTITPTQATGVENDQERVFDIVEQMPEFPDGGMSAMMKFLSRNVKYPVNAQKNKVQGRVTLTFIVEKDGSITHETITQSVNPELDNEALRVVRLMPKWKPGMQRGKAVRVKYTVPIAFRLNNAPLPKGTPKAAGAKANKENELMVVGYGDGTPGDKVFDVVEVMPEYPDGGMKGMMEFVSKNIKYPVNAVKNRIEGRVVIQFVVEKDGSITNEKVIKGVNPELDEEALRVYRLMPKWKPGMQRGKAVRVKYTSPILFKLPPKEKKSAQAG